MVLFLFVHHFFMDLGYQWAGGIINNAAEFIAVLIKLMAMILP
jgi:hypothetical protein